jgi:hypothetical protein
VLAEQVEAKLANGEQVDIQQHATLSSTLVRLAQRIGIDRAALDVTPSLTSTLASIAAEQEAYERAYAADDEATEEAAGAPLRRGALGPQNKPYPPFWPNPPPPSRESRPNPPVWRVSWGQPKAADPRLCARSCPLARCLFRMQTHKCLKLLATLAEF